jgi:glucose/arabinose dehydrogenase
MSFVPSIGISEIIRLPNNFSNFWQDNFLVASLNKKTLYRFKFDENFTKVLYFEEIFIGDRIRDIIYLEDEKIILLTLEMSGSIGMIKL